MSEVAGGNKDGGDVELSVLPSEKRGTVNDAFQPQDGAADSKPSPQVN